MLPMRRLRSDGEADVNQANTSVNGEAMHDGACNPIRKAEGLTWGGDT